MQHNSAIKILLSVCKNRVYELTSASRLVHRSKAKTMLFSVFDKKASKTRCYIEPAEMLSKFLNLRSLLFVNDWFRNENNAVFGVFLQRLLIIFAFLSCLTAFSQEERRMIREGNNLYEEGDYGSAIEKFMRASELIRDKRDIKSNIGAANYRKGEFETAVNNFEDFLESIEDSHQKADAFYNMGNSLFQTGDYENSMNAYKNALRLNPDHNQSRYNMAIVNKILEQQQQQQQQDDGQQEQNEQEQDEDEQDSKQEDEEQEQEDDQRDMSQGEIESLLQAIEDIDRELQGRAQDHLRESERREVERNW